ncbi:MAG: hypothetical protein ACXWR1_14980 [Bdellovibrionota bacterium]
MLKTFILFIALAPLAARADTSFSRLLARVQGTYLKNAAPYPILIMDRDELEWRFVRAGAVHDTDTAQREDLIRAYVKEKTGVSIAGNAASNFEPYLTQLKDAAIAMPALKDGTEKPVVEMCAVFPPDPNRNQGLEMERLLQLRTAEAYGEHKTAELRTSMSYDDAVLFSLLHESGHCLDQTFFPQLLDGDTDSSTIHASESFAETVAVFLMAKEGRENVTDSRAYLRDMYSYFMEPYFVSHPELGFGTESFTYGGLIYHLSPSIRAAAKLVKTNNLSAMPLPEVLALSRHVVEKSAFETRFITALFAGYNEGHETTLTRYRGYETEMPDLFGGIVERLQAYWQDEISFRANAFKTADPAAPTTELLPFDQTKACASLAGGDYDGLRDQIETLRLDLRSGNPAYASQVARFNLLSNLWKNLPALCKGGTKLIPAPLAPSLFLDAVVPAR